MCLHPVSHQPPADNVYGELLCAAKLPKILVLAARTFCTFFFSSGSNMQLGEDRWEDLYCLQCKRLLTAGQDVQGHLWLLTERSDIRDLLEFLERASPLTSPPSLLEVALGCVLSGFADVRKQLHQ